MIEDLLAGLNPEQQRAVETTEGPLLIQAGAGSGKTKTLTHRIAYIIANNKATPFNILAVTFTNKAAKEMRERVARLLGQSADNRGFMPFMGTFHAICVRLLRQDGEHVGIPRSFVIFDESDRQAAVKQASKLAHIDEKSFPARMLSGIISSAKNDMSSPLELADMPGSTPAQRAAAKVYPLYETALKEASALDFDDLINRTVHLLQTQKEIRAKWQKQFKYIMIDEYQDTNTAQYKLVKLLTNADKNIAVVGDDWQCLPPDAQVETPSGLRKIKDVVPGDAVRSAAGYGRSGFFKVTARKQFDHAGELVTIKTSSGKELRCTPNHLVFARWDATDSYLVYLMYARGKGYRIGLAKGMRFDGKKDAFGLRVRANQERADRMWVLKVCASRQEAIYAEALYAYQYGIPMTVFHAFTNRALRMDQASIDAIFQEIDTQTRSKKLMADLGLAFDYPDFVPQATTRNGMKRVNINVVLFGDKRTSERSAWSASRISANTTDRRDLQIFEAAGYTVRAGRAGTFRSEIHNIDYGKIEGLAERLGGGIEEASIRRYAYITASQYNFMPAAQVHPGMIVAAADDGAISEERVIAVSKAAYTGSVYDLDVEKVHNYAASGIIVHNSIYSWRGADFRNILNFEHDYPNCTVIKLEQNYRSTKAILDAAHAVITKNHQRSEKKLWTEASNGMPVQMIQVGSERAEGEAIVRRIKNAVDGGFRRYNHFAVLYRTNAQSRSIEETFIHYGIPYRIVGGQRFYDRKEIKDLMAYLRLIYQPEDRISFARIVNVPTRGIGAKSLETFYQWMESTGKNLFEALNEVATCGSLTTKAQNSLGELADILARLRDLVDDTPPAGILDSLIRRIDYLNYLDDGTPQAESRQENVKELIGVAQEYQDLGLAGFLEEVALVSDVDQANFDGNAVTLMTLHAAKGLEFPVVFMVGMEETVFPHTRAVYDQFEMEEERRLCYVGMTRAREELYMVYATSRSLYGGVQHNPPSRFLSEIDAEFQPAESSFGMSGGWSATEDSYVQRAPDQGWQPAGQHPPRAHEGARGRGGRADRTPTFGDDVRYVVDGDAQVAPHLAEGDKVQHQVFGVGTVVELDGENATIFFKGKGVKKLNIAFAPLKKL
ncbi:MAG TPA: UvrD-helicase domain-containing protein [Candidatus Saccharimonadales bacterium]|nr:UvrD-helicase domain-containing protein [Candidatus Saccharimonadales bacterium]